MIGETRVCEKELRDTTQDDGVHWGICHAYEKTHRRKIRDNEEQSACEKACKARVREANEKRDNQCACYLLLRAQKSKQAVL